MKDLKKFINESLIIESNFNFDKKFEFAASWGLVDLMNKSNNIKDMDASDFEENDIYINDESQLSQLQDALSWFKTILKKSYTYEGDGNFMDDYDPYEYFELKSSEHGLILFQDGDDGRYSLFLFKKALTGQDKKKLAEFMACLNNSPEMGLVREF